MLESTKDRDTDQVVSRWSQVRHIIAPHNILMVDQLWLWTTHQTPKTPPSAPIETDKQNQQTHPDTRSDDDLASKQQRHYVVSSFPSRVGASHRPHRTQGDPRVLVLDAGGRKRDPIRKPQDLVSRILETCCNLFDRLQDIDTLRFFQMFEESIGKVVSPELLM